MSNCKNWHGEQGTANVCAGSEAFSCYRLCQQGQTNITGPPLPDGSDPSCDPSDRDLPEIIEACKAWDYQLEKDGLSWTKPYDFETYQNLGHSGLMKMCVGQGSISFPKSKFPCVIHGTGNMPCTAHVYIDNNKTKADAIEDFFRAKMIECGADVYSNQFCVVDVEGIEAVPVPVAISIGHGVLDGVCGSISLMRYSPPSGWKKVDCDASKGRCKNKGANQRQAPTGFGAPRYMLNAQLGMRSFSGEFKSWQYLAPNNQGGSGCDVPSVKKLDWDTAQKWLSKKSYGVQCSNGPNAANPCTKMP